MDKYQTIYKLYPRERVNTMARCKECVRCGKSFITVDFTDEFKPENATMQMCKDCAEWYIKNNKPLICYYRSFNGGQ